MRISINENMLSISRASEYDLTEFRAPPSRGCSAPKAYSTQALFARERAIKSFQTVHAHTDYELLYDDSGGRVKRRAWPS